jgi:hypothetical protein
MEYRAMGTRSPFTATERLTNNKNGTVCRKSIEPSSGSNGPCVRIPYERHWGESSGAAMGEIRQRAHLWGGGDENDATSLRAAAPPISGWHRLTAD